MREANKENEEEMKRADEVHGDSKKITRSMKKRKRRNMNWTIFMTFELLLRRSVSFDVLVWFPT